MDGIEIDKKLAETKTSQTRIFRQKLKHLFYMQK